MKYRILSFSIGWLLLTCVVYPQEPFRVAFYNVENLFDTQNDSLKKDEEFLPDGFMRWTPYKYWEKLRNLTRVITAIGEMDSPAVVGLCEVENDSVLFDLTKRSPLRKQGYEYLITHSPDYRGIDVALLYQPHQLRLLKSEEYEVAFQRKHQRPTRNILHVVGEVLSGDTLDLFVCHMPSRSEGQKETEPARIDANTLLRRKCDSILHVREKAHILIMGDFNDQPRNKSISQVLGAEKINKHPKPYTLYNLFLTDEQNRKIGTYKYKGRWELIDQFIVSGNLLMSNSSIQVKNNSTTIFQAPFLLEDDKRYYGTKPFRTSQGPRYLGGFSDHLPIQVDLIIQTGE